MDKSAVNSHTYFTFLIRIIRLLHLLFILPLRLNQLLALLLQRLAITTRDRRAVRIVRRHGRRVR
jgi:hypothetical protein